MTDDEPQFSTKDKPGAYDAIETAKPGEPLFPIQGGDPFGPPTVQYWADLARAAALELDEDDPKRARLLDKALSAEQVGWAMQAYQRREEIDALTTGRATYSGDQQVETRLWRAGLISGTKHLREAASSFSDAADHLPADQAEALRAVVDKINGIATDYEPRRASYGSQPELPISAGAER